MTKSSQKNDEPQIRRPWERGRLVRVHGPKLVRTERPSAEVWAFWSHPGKSRSPRSTDKLDSGPAGM